MPERETIERARQDAREGKAPSTQAGEFVREEIHHIREGKHGARSTKQAIAIGLSKARRAGVKLPRKKSAKKATTRKSAKRSAAAKKAARTKGPAKRSAAARKRLRGLPRKAASKRALSEHARKSAAQRSPRERSAAAKKAARTRARAK
jgi:hypothetical protein